METEEDTGGIGYADAVGQYRKDNPSPAPALEKLTEALNTEPRKESILDEAARIIYGDREKNYGHPGKNLEAIADLWDTYLHRAGLITVQDLGVTPNHVCMMMILMKIARLLNAPDHRDSQVDIAGYVALMERVQQFYKSKPSHE